MSRKHYFITLIIVSLFTAFLVAYAANLLFNDIGNIGVGMSNSTFLVSLPAASIAAIFVALLFYFVRVYQRPKTFKAITKFYLILILVLGGLAFLTSLLSGLIVYHSFVKPYPFPGSLIISMVVGLLFVGGAVTGLIFLKKVQKEDEETFKIKASYVFKTIGWAIFVGLAFYRLGLLIMSPMFIYWRNFYLTFPLYILLLVPFLLLVTRFLQILNLISDRRVFVSSIIIGALGIMLTIYTVFVGSMNTGFISALSQVMPLERLASMPIQLILHFAICVAVALVMAIPAIKRLKASKNVEQ